MAQQGFYETQLSVFWYSSVCYGVGYSKFHRRISMESQFTSCMCAMWHVFQK